MGDVILHGKKKYWKRGGANHYHLTLQAGENTLEAQLARLLLRHVAGSDRKAEMFRAATWLEEYEVFMTTPGTHNDTYAATAHRTFFANRLAGRALEDCADNDGHNVDAIDAFTSLPVVAGMYALAGEGGKGMQSAADACIAATRKSSVLGGYTAPLVQLVLGAATSSETLRQLAVECGTALGVDVAAAAKRARGDPMTACYVNSSVPAFLQFVYKYGPAVDEAVAGGEPGPVEAAVARALLASANAGGENVARGALLGAVVGARAGAEAAFGGWLKQGLLDSEAIEAEIRGRRGAGSGRVEVGRDVVGVWRK